MSAAISLLQALINSAEKASNIARVCRANEQLLSLLVQEKSGTEANARFEHDFKTLADVLIQETIKHDVGALFPAMCEAIKGEESPNFTNTLCESVAIAVGETATDTAHCLATVLHDNLEAAKALAAEVHNDVSYAAANLGTLPDLPNDLDYSQLGVWIDPIDATAEYISGDSIFTNFPGITSTGLDCVTVLIGVYERQTGVPVLGVISQPFHKKIADNFYESQLYWGVCLPSLKANNCRELQRGQHVNRLGIFSSSERAEILQRVMDLGYEFAFSAGAGHKALKVVTAEVDLYLLSKGSTFKWDTCAPHAILRSLGGDMYDYKKSLDQRKPVSLSYLEDNAGEDDDDWKCNSGGLIAVRDVTLVEPLLEKLCDE